MTQTQAVPTVAERSVRLGYNHGYRIDGDIASLNAEISLPAASTDSSGLSERSERDAPLWELQLWACDQPYTGGSLSGVKIAEAPLSLAAASSEPQRLQTETFARLPAGDRDYSMVLVLAERTADAREEVRDFANYPERAHFLVPRLFGDVVQEKAAKAAGGNAAEQVTLRVQGIHNPRLSNNLSGTLKLELWALPQAYLGGVFEGELLAGVEVGQVAGQNDLRDLSYTLALASNAAGYGQRVLMLREWTAKGYVTRDYRNLVASQEPSQQAERAPAPNQTAETHETAGNKPRRPSEQSGLTFIHSAFVGDFFEEQLAHVRKLGELVLQRRAEWRWRDLLPKQARELGEKAVRRVRSLLGFGK